MQPGCLRKGFALWGIVAAAAAFVGAAPANAGPPAITIVGNDCTDLADGVLSSCHMQPNITPDGTFAYPQAEDVYNAWALANGAGQITLNFLTEFQDVGPFSDGFGSIINNGDTGSFNFAGYDIDFYAVKSSKEFWIFELPGNTSSGNWAVPDGQDMSHILFFGTASAVPEPAVWAMMLIGFGAIGGAMRGRKRRPAVQFA